MCSIYAALGAMRRCCEVHSGLAQVTEHHTIFQKDLFIYLNEFQRERERGLPPANTCPRFHNSHGWTRNSIWVSDGGAWTEACGACPAASRGAPEQGAGLEAAPGAPCYCRRTPQVSTVASAAPLGPPGGAAARVLGPGEDEPAEWWRNGPSGASWGHAAVHPQSCLGVSSFGAVTAP